MLLPLIPIAISAGEAIAIGLSSVATGLGLYNFFNHNERVDEAVEDLAHHMDDKSKTKADLLDAVAENRDDRHNGYPKKNTRRYREKLELAVLADPESD